MKTMEKEQLNARVRREFRQVIGKLADECNFTNEELVEVAFAALIGTKDTIIEAKRAMAASKARELNLSFEEPDHQPDWALA